MLATCCATCCVREGAPERGDARRRCLPFFGKFWAEQVLGCSALKRRLEGAERLRSDLCASRSCAGSDVARIAAARTELFFFGCKTRDDPETARMVSGLRYRPRLQDQG